MCKIEIHREKRQVVRNVDKAQAIVELNAVEDSDGLRCDIDVIEPQISVAIENTPVCNSLFEEAIVLREEGVCEVSYRLKADR